LCIILQSWRSLPGSKTKATTCFGPLSSPFRLLFLWFFLIFCFSLLLVFVFFPSSSELDPGYCSFERDSTVPLLCFRLPVLPSSHSCIPLFPFLFFLFFFFCSPLAPLLYSSPLYSPSLFLPVRSSPVFLFSSVCYVISFLSSGIFLVSLSTLSLPLLSCVCLRLLSSPSPFFSSPWIFFSLYSPFPLLFVMAFLWFLWLENVIRSPPDNEATMHGL